jgi:hypothetical protein
MKFLALTLLVVALSAHFTTAQPPARKAPASGAAAADVPDASLILATTEKPFEAPCGLKNKLEGNCKEKSGAEKPVRLNLNRIV